MTQHDIVIIGGGSAGYSAAIRSAQLGMRTVLIEADKVGGTCLHRGCIPTKALLQAAATADTVREAAGFGIGAELTSIDPEAIVAYSDQVVGKLYSGLEGLLKGSSVQVVSARGELLLDPLRVVAQGQEFEAGAVVLATGASPITLGLPVDGERVITSEHALRLTSLPRSAVVIGGGVIGVEFASAWASLGVEVTIVEALDRLVPAEEPQTSAALARAFRQRGIRMKMKTRVVDTKVDESGVKVVLDGGQLSTDLVLVAVGRKADPSNVGLKSLEVKEDLSTDIPGVYAVGDLAPGPQLAHRGYSHGYYIAELIAHRAGKHDALPSRQPDHTMPRVTYCSPEIVSVGLTAQQASEKGEIEVVEYALTGNGKAQILAGANQRVRGSVRIVRFRDDAIAGVHLIGEHVGELVGEANLMVGWEAAPADLNSLVHAHPSLGEALGEAALVLGGKPLHAHS